MATAIFYNLAAHGHINPTLPLVAELVRRGDRIIYYSTEPLRAKVEATGAEFRPYGSAYLRDPSHNAGGPAGLMATTIRAAQALLPDLLQQAQHERAGYLLIDSMCVWGNLVQQRLGCPAITSCTTFALNPKAQSPLQRFEPTLVRQLLAGLPRLLDYVRIARRVDRRFGTRSPGFWDFFANRQALNLVYTSREFQPGADHFDDSYRFVGPSLAPRAEGHDFPMDWLGSEGAIYVSMGTIFNDAAPVFRAAVEAFGGADRQVVIAAGDKVDPAALGPIPSNVLVRRFVPQLEVLERAAAFVTHGGMNSASEALWFGVPMVVLPQVGDQYFVGWRLEELGAGRYLPPRRVTAQRLRQFVGEVLADDRYRREAAQLGQTLRAAGGYRRAADEIFAFKQRYGLN